MSPVILLRSLRMLPALLVLAGAGCSRPQTLDFGTAEPAAPAPPASDDQARKQMVEVVLPVAIDIQGPFTRPASFDKDNVPDGIEVVLEAVDHQDQTTRMVGHLVLELYNHRQAAADPKGSQLQVWELDMATEKDQESYFNRLTRMYEFPLLVDRTQVPQSKQFVLVARYTNPWGKHIETEEVLDIEPLLWQARSAQTVGAPAPHMDRPPAAPGSGAGQSPSGAGPGNGPGPGTSSSPGISPRPGLAGGSRSSPGANAGDNPR